MLRRHAGRRTNLALLLLLCAAGATGTLGFALGTPSVRWVLVGHAVAGFAIVALVPWKAAIARRGLRHRNRGRTASLGFGILVAASILFGLLHSTGSARMIGPLTAMQLHVGAAVAALPFAVWHVAARRARPRRTDLSRRTMLRSAALLGSSAIAYGAVESALRLGGFPGGKRRFTGSYRASSGALPVTQWLTDGVPRIDVERWRLTVRARDGERVTGYSELTKHRDRVSAVLDCTGGWFSTQEWEGIRLDRLIGTPNGARSIDVVSSTGYARRFPIGDAPRLVLAVRMGSRPLETGHGFPARLVAPGRRGFWWVKWVDLVELSDTPWWWQAPFPLT